MSKYRHRDIENRWKRRWIKEKLYNPAIDRAKKTFYNLWMYPYPSAEGLHAGHAFASTGSDVYGRFMRMKGRDVFQPIGYDSFGIHSENFALSISEHPEKMLSRTTKYYEKQLKSIGHGYDWTKTVTTSKKDYYVWTQWIFTAMFKAGLACRKEASVNWCPSCKTVLADEQVIAGECERCDHKVETKVLKQWFFRITDYAEKLLGNLEKINWPEKIKLAQKNWIGRSKGALIDFKVQNSKLKIKSFTTRPDTLYGATFFVISPEHPNVADVTVSKHKSQVQQYLRRASKKSKEDRIADKGTKTGVNTGGFVINPATGKKIPVYVADYVVMEYGTGAVMGVPGHDERDRKFAQKFNIAIQPVVVPERVYKDSNAKSYYKKRSIIHKNLLLKLAKEAFKARKKMIVHGGWAVFLHTGTEFRDFEDLDLIIMENELNWWKKTLQSEGLKISNMFPEGKNPKYYFQATKKDTHVDVLTIRLEKDKGVVWLGGKKPEVTKDAFKEVFEKKKFQGIPVYVASKENLYMWKVERVKNEIRWKEQADFLFMGYKSYQGHGRLINSGKYSGMKSETAIEKIINDLENKKLGKQEIQYHLRDWLISRQRYWGPPIPMIFCESCANKDKSWFDNSKLLHKDQSDWNHAGWYPEEKLPVELPSMENYQPKGTGRGPLDANPSFYETKCPDCESYAKRETDVSDTFLDSSWYFLAYPMKGTKVWKEGPSTSSGHDLLKNKIIESWLPVDLYFGGAEHAVLHLMYSRFVTQVFYDLKMLHFDEPFSKLFAHGLMIKDGAKMSKSRGNVVNPDEYVEKFGADTLRLYLMFIGPMDGYPDFRDTGIEGMRRFVDRIWELFKDHKNVVLEAEEDAKEVLIKLHQTIKKVTEDIEKYHYNTAISAIMEFVNLLREKAMVSKSTNRKLTCAEWDESLSVLIRLLAPFTPFLSEEVWVGVLDKKFSVHTSTWPQFEPELVKEDTVTFIVQVNGKLRATLDIKEQRSRNKDRVVKTAKADSNVKKWLKGKKIKTTIFVPGKLINFVI